MGRLGNSAAISAAVGVVGTAKESTGDWLRNARRGGAELSVSKIKSTASITAMICHRAGGESVWRGDRHRLVLAPDALAPVSVQVEQGRTLHVPFVEPGSITFYPAGVTLRNIHPAAKLVQVLWDTEVYFTLLPEVAAATSRFEFLGDLRDPLLGPIINSLTRASEGCFADGILMESLGIAMCIRIAQRFIGQLPLPCSHGLSPERLRRVLDYVEAHLDSKLSLTTLAAVACLSPYHFSRSARQSIGIGPHQYVIKRRVEQAKTLLQLTKQPIASIARAVGFVDQSHLTTILRRETGITPGRFRSASA